jgi:large subunit ribosomal protein L19
VQNRILQLVEDANKKTDIPDFQVGATVEVHQRILEGQKERIQVFTGDVIARKGAGVRETFTVRRLVQGEGVERVFLVHSPKIAKIVVKRRGKVRRAKLYYLRKRVGKATRLKEREKASPAKTEPKTEAPASNATPTA